MSRAGRCWWTGPATRSSWPTRHERYILKLTPPEYPLLVENEAFFLEWSRRCKIPTAAARLVHDGEGTSGLLLTRFDRISHDGEPRSLAVEDACQALDLWPADKYNTGLESASQALMRLSTAPAVTARGILQQLVFAWLSGNGDLHAKNLSVVATPTGEMRLAPAYDLPSTLYYGDTTLALTVGERDTLSRARLREFAASLGSRRPPQTSPSEPCWREQQNSPSRSSPRGRRSTTAPAPRSFGSWSLDAATSTVGGSGAASGS